MAQARRRVARALGTVQRIPGAAQAPRRPGANPDHGAPPTAALARVSAALEEIRPWLAEFHPHPLMELDYGGLEHLLDDAPLRPDQSLAALSAPATPLPPIPSHPSTP